MQPCMSWGGHVCVCRLGRDGKDDFELRVADANADTERNYNDDFKSTSADAANMRRMGKQQRLVRRFRVLSMASFVAVATAAWEFTIFNLTAGLTNGGLPMLIYPMIWNFIGFCPIYLSMAEMASMAPIAGAQYHWVSEFAPESLQRGLSYLTGYVAPHFLFWMLLTVKMDVYARMAGGKCPRRLPCRHDHSDPDIPI